MPTYLATNSVADWSVATPAGTDSPADIDDALREIKTVMTAVVRNTLTDKGGIRVGRIYHPTANAVPSGASINTWTRRPLDTKSDITSLIAAGAHVNSWKPIAGYYMSWLTCLGYRLGQCISRIAEATGAATSSAIAGSFSTHTNLAFANDATASAANIASMMHLNGIFQADGIKSYCVETMFSDANNTDGFGRAVPAGFTAPLAGHLPVRTEWTLMYLGTTLP